MSNLDEYRANADECQRMADIARVESEKLIWLQMARHWLWRCHGQAQQER